MQNYKDLKVWLKAHQFRQSVYVESKSYLKEEIFSLINQLRRAAYSMPANIAEGGGKNTQLDFAKYLNIALASANESGYFILLSKDLGYLTIDKYETLTSLINEIKAMLIALISKVRT
jgi:four helix bundle protein